MVKEKAGTGLKERLRGALRRDSSFRRWGWAVVFAIAFTALFWSSIVPERYDLKVGQVAPKDIKAPRSTVDQFETQRLRREAADEINYVFEVDPQVAGETGREVTSMFAALRRVRAAHPGTAWTGEDPAVKAGLDELRAELSAAPARNLADADLLALLALPEAGLQAAEPAVAAALQRALTAGVKSEVLSSFRSQVETEITGTLEANDAVVHLAQALLRPNMVLNWEETLRRRKRAEDAVTPVRILEGEFIVREGERVSERQVALLGDLGLSRRGETWRSLFGSALLAAALFGMVGAYLAHLAPRLIGRESTIIILGIAATATLVLAQGLRSTSSLLAPVAMGAMLVGVLLGRGPALVTGVVLAVAVGVTMGFEFRALFVALVGAVAAVFGLGRLGQRSDLLRTGGLVAVANVVAIGIAALLLGTASPGPMGLWRDLGIGLVNGALCAILTIGSLPLFESYFGILTSVRLLELSNPNQAVLRRLLVEAPGTYHHSVMVANLAEAAAQAVGADPLLARVGAYFHDIGKLKRPYFFIENQFAGDNPHDKISPSLSVLILTSHVRDGLELARAARLPEAVQEFIGEHHGTTLVSFFYSRAAENGREEQLIEHDFRYDGPRPHTRETAVVMLADSAEAAVRALPRPTPARIEGLVQAIIRERLADHQLDRCDLTFRDLDAVAETLVRVLTGVFHPRIEYPDMPLSEAQRREGKRGDEERAGDGAGAGAIGGVGAGDAGAGGGSGGAGQGDGGGRGRPEHAQKEE